MSPALASFAAAAAATAIVLAGGARAQTEVAPDALVKNVTLEVVDIIQKDIKDGDRKKLVALIETKVLPHFNFQAMTASAVGRNWDKATPEQKTRLND
jgi:phospholipid transport system substrate-binding protein